VVYQPGAEKEGKKFVDSEEGIITSFYHCYSRGSLISCPPLTQGKETKVTSAWEAYMSCVMPLVS